MSYLTTFPPHQVNVKQPPFNAKGGGITNDDTVAIQNAVNAVVARYGSGVVYLPADAYNTTSMLVVPSGVVLVGDGGHNQTARGAATSIIGNHSQDAIVTLQGSTYCQISNLDLQGPLSGPFPKTGLLLGRNSGASAGWHTFTRLSITGRFSVAGLYNVASEGNTYNDLQIRMDGSSSAKKCIYLSGGDSGGLSPATPLVGSSLAGAEFNNSMLVHYGTAPDVSCIYIDGSVATGYITFRGGCLTQNNGCYVSIRNGMVDGKDTYGAIIFEGMGGEHVVGTPLAGFNLFASVGAPVALRGLQIRGCSFAFFGSGYYIMQDAFVKLMNAVILSQGIDRTNSAALTYVPSMIGVCRAGSPVLAPGENSNCLIDVGAGLIPNV